jgi:hypothetical protein
LGHCRRTTRRRGSKRVLVFCTCPISSRDYLRTCTDSHRWSGVRRPRLCLATQARSCWRLRLPEPASVDGTEDRPSPARRTRHEPVRQGTGCRTDAQPKVEEPLRQPQPPVTMRRDYVPQTGDVAIVNARASRYGRKFHGKRTASGGSTTCTP